MTAIAKLVSLEREAEGAIDGENDIARDCLSIARGYIELHVQYGEPLNIKAVERELVEVASFMDQRTVATRNFLLKLRSAAAWLRLQSMEIHPKP